METVPSPDTLVVPPYLLAVLQATAVEEHRSAADVLRDAVQRYVWKGIWQETLAKSKARAKERGFTEEDVTRVARKVSEMSFAELEAIGSTEMDAELTEPGQ